MAIPCESKAFGLLEKPDGVCVGQLSGVGAGFLLGSVLGVIIPEGFESLIEVRLSRKGFHPAKLNTFASVCSARWIIIHVAKEKWGDSLDILELSYQSHFSSELVPVLY